MNSLDSPVIYFQRLCCTAMLTLITCWTIKNIGSVGRISLRYEKHQTRKHQNSNNNNNLFCREPFCQSVCTIMTIFNFYLFDRNGTCLYYTEWNRKKQLTMSKDEEFKLMYGMIFSLKSFVSRLSPYDMKEGFQTFNTSKYKLHFFETASGLKFIMNTDTQAANMKDVLQQIFSSLYVEYVVKNPLCELDQPISSELFKNKLDEYVRALPNFQAKSTS